MQGLTFPPDAGFPFDSSKERFYMMTTQYRFSNIPKDSADIDTTDTPSVLPLLDNSGLRIFVTPNLRNHDAGVLSIGKCNKQSERHSRISKRILPFNSEYEIDSNICYFAFDISIQFAFAKIRKNTSYLMLARSPTYERLCVLLCKITLDWHLNYCVCIFDRYESWVASHHSARPYEGDFRRTLPGRMHTTDISGGRHFDFRSSDANTGHRQRSETKTGKHYKQI